MASSGMKTIYFTPIQTIHFPLLFCLPPLNKYLPPLSSPLPNLTATTLPASLLMFWLIDNVLT